MSDTSRIIEKLRIKELVERSTCATDRRSCDVLITPKGLKLLDEIDQTNDELDSIFSSLSARDMKQLNGLLDDLRG
jgi:DNA-binding MarR family transcriptional regulator